MKNAYTRHSTLYTDSITIAGRAQKSTIRMEQRKNPERYTMAELLNNQSAAGVNVQGVADPAADINKDIDDKEIDIIEDDIDDNEPDINEGEGEDEANESSEAEQSAASTKQTPEQNAAFAEIRRKAEADARAKAQADAQRIIDQTIADMGMRDPYTGKAITTKAEYDAYKTRHETEIIGKELGKAGISREAMDALIASHPAIKQAQEAAKAYEEAQRSAQEQAARARLEEQIKAISALDPSIKTADDLVKLPEYDKLRGYVQKGLSIEEAYKLTYMDKLADKKTAAAAQSAINKVASKEHLAASTSRGQGETPIPRKQYEMFKLINPNMPDKKIKEYWAKYSKENKN